MPFRAVWSLAVIVGATVKLGFIWLLADTLNALMAIPNLIALWFSHRLCLRSPRSSSIRVASPRIIRSKPRSEIWTNLTKQAKAAIVPPLSAC